MALNDPWFIGTRFYRTAGDWACTAGNVSGTAVTPYALANAIGAVPSDAVAVLLRGTHVAIATGVADTELSVGLAAYKTEVDAPQGSVDESIGDVREPSGLVAGVDIVMKMPFTLVAKITNTTPMEVTLRGTYSNNNGYAEDIAILGWWLP